MDDGKSWLFGRCTSGALVLSSVHLLTVIGTGYQAGHFDKLGFGTVAAFVVNYAIFLSPVAVLLILRSFGCFWVALYGCPIVIFFVLRMHHLWEFHQHGINSMAVQKGDGLSWLEMLFEIAALPVLALLLVGYLGYLLSRLLSKGTNG